MSDIFVGDVHPPTGNPDEVFTIGNVVPGEQAAGPVAGNRLQDGLSGLTPTP